MVNKNITERLLCYFFYIQNTEFILTFVNIIDSSKVFKYKKTELPESVLKNPDRLFLMDSEGKFLSHKEEKEICQCIKVENYVLNQIGVQDYREYYKNSNIKSFNEYLKVKDLQEIVKLENHSEQITNKVILTLKSFLQKNKLKGKNEIKFQYISRDLDGISPINKLIQKYPIKKENFTYTLICSKGEKNQILKEVKETLNEFIKTTDIETQYQILN